MGLLMTRAFAMATVTTVAITLAGCNSKSSSAQGNHTTTPRSTHSPHKTRPKEHCGSSGCAMVRLTRSLPQTTVLYGASCTGVQGSWFFNAIEGGGSSVLRPSYSLRWSFAGGASSARPNARIISVPPTTTTTVTVTLSNGVMKLHGTRTPNGSVTASGTLVVKLTGSASSPSLTFIETGLSGAEHKLGLLSPFDAGGHPLVVPIQHVTTLAGC
jgi:hypothetical protein